MDVDLATVPATWSTEAPSSSDMSNDVTWKKHYHRVMCQMAVTSLKQALRCKDKAMLQRALQDCQLHGVKPEVTPQIAQAQRVLVVLECRQNLLDAIVSKDVDRLRFQLTVAEEGNFRKTLATECRKAEITLRQLHRKQERHTELVDLSRFTLSELRSYRTPVPALHRVLQVAFLLRGIDEKTTAEWGTCKRLALARGHMTVLQWVEEAENQAIHPEVASRAAQILSGIHPDEARDAGVAAFTFFVWAKGKVDVLRDTLSGVSPADIPRQRELLGRTTPPEPELMPYLKRNKERRRRLSMRRRSTITAVSHERLDPDSVTAVSHETLEPDSITAVSRETRDPDSRKQVKDDTARPPDRAMTDGVLPDTARAASPEVKRGFLPPIVTTSSQAF